MSGDRRIWAGRLALAAAVVIWSTPPIFQYWLARPFDAWTQNFYRYAAGFLTMVPFLVWMAWRSPRGMTRTEWFGCAGAAVPNVIHQVAQTMAVVLLWPYALLGAIIWYAVRRYRQRRSLPPTHPKAQPPVPPPSN